MGLDLSRRPRLPRRVSLVAAGGSFWLSMMIAPQGSNLFLEVGPVIATSTSGAVATLAVLGRSPGEQAPAAADPRSEPRSPVPAPARAARQRIARSR